MSKLPELPDFFKKEEEQQPKEVKKTEELKKEPKVPEAPHQFPLNQEEVKMEENKEEIISIEDKPKMFNLIHKLIIGSLTLIVLLLIGSTTYFYLEMNKFKEKYTAIDSRILVLTKEIASLNQENNNLSGKVVNYQQELENIKQVETNSDQMQQALIELETKNKELIEQLDSLQNKSPEVKEVVKTQNVTPKATVSPPVNSPTKVAKVSGALAEHLTNFELQIKTNKQKQCLAYFRNETLKRCTDKYPNLNQLTTTVKEVEVSGQKIQKLVYKCQDSSGKGKTFKYGPLEMKNNCLN